MKILSLDLIAFGPFSNHKLDLSGGERGLHLIHGPNEAGKSTTLRALSDFLFGIPDRSNDSFLHEYAAMRVGATLLDRNGKSITLVRRKGRKPNLETPEGETREDAVLAPFIGASTRETFEQHHRFDHAQLVEGGKDMLKGEGDFGKMLFAAGSGVAGFRGVLTGLESEIKEMFAPTGRTKSINAALTRLKEVRAGRKQDTLAPSLWSDVDRRKTQAEEARGELDARIKELNAERRRRERILHLLPLAARLRETRSKVEARAGVRPLPIDFSDRWSKAKHAHPSALRTRGEAVSELEAIDLELAALPPPDPILDAADELNRLREEKGGYLKAVEALPKITTAVEVLENRLAKLTAEVARGRDQDGEDLPVPSLQARKETEKLQKEHIKLSTEHAAARTEVHSFADESDPISDDLLARFDDLKARKNRWQSHVRIDEEIAKRRAAAKGSEEKTNAALARLPFWSAGLAPLETLPFPSAETVEARESERAKQDRTLNDLISKIEELDEEIAELDRRAAGAALDGGVPTEEDLAKARDTRDALWAVLRDRLSKKSDPIDPSSIAEYEKQVKQGDVLADRLRREADRVAEELRRRIDREAKEHKRDRLISKRDEAQAAAEQWSRAWTSLWSAVGIAPGGPKEMLAWLKKREDVIKLGEEADRLRRDLEAERETRDRLAEEIRDCLSRFGETPDRDEPLAGLIDVTEALLNRIERGRALTQARRRFEKAEAALLDWNARWKAALEALGLDHRLDPDAVAAQFELRTGIERAREELEGKHREAAEHRLTVRHYAEAARALADRFAPELAEVPADKLAVKLVDRFREAGTVAQRRAVCLEKRDAAAGRVAAADRAIAEAELMLSILKQEAGKDDLAQAEADWKDLLTLRIELQKLENDLLASGEGVPLDRLLSDLESENAEAVQARLDQIESDLAPLESRRDELIHEIGKLSGELARHDGGSRAAEAEQDAQAILAKIGTEAESYIRLKLGSALLKNAMDRYREKNTGPILKKASAIFQHLTLGSFSHLLLDDEGKLRCGRGGGRSVPTDGLSEGTADALYLSLRLAALHAELDRQDPIPFVVDDILVNLDERRSAAAIETLADLSKRTQVLLFTHHAHVVEIARGHLKEGSTLFVHRLPGPGP